MALPGRDTIFIQKHVFDSPVNNVVIGDNGIYVKTGDRLYRYEGGHWTPSPLNFTKPYVFFQDGAFYETDFIPSGLLTDIRGMAYLIPQKSLANPTTAERDGRLLLSVGGSLFEYEIINYYSRSFKNASIRDVFVDTGLTVISTYSGIFVNGALDTTAPYYANGAFVQIGDAYYLCQDKLYRYARHDGFRPVENASNEISGNIRKLVEFDGRMVSLNTRSINYYDTLTGLQALHAGLEYTALAVMEKDLFFASTGGELFRFDGQTVSQITDMGARISDLVVFHDSLYVVADRGVFQWTRDPANPLRQLVDLPMCVGMVVDWSGTMWISTLSGLYFFNEALSGPEPLIPRVEFNRDALAVLENHLYAGSIEGLFVIDVDVVQKQIMPRVKNPRLLPDLTKERLLTFVIVAALALSSAYLIYRKRTRKIILPGKTRPQEPLTLARIEQDILGDNITTVEGLAEYYQTNTVQLNRKFKSFDTTPGKFLKKVKLKQAEMLLREGVQIDEVARQVGYSPQYIRKNIG